MNIILFFLFGYFLFISKNSSLLYGVFQSIEFSIKSIFHSILALQVRWE